jgi:hypothetical protein
MTFHMYRSVVLSAVLLVTLSLCLSVEGFSTLSSRPSIFATQWTTTSLTATPRNKQAPRIQKITSKRRKELGINDDEDEYDLEMALDNNTDPIITKIIAGSLIVSIMSLLIYGIVIPATTDYGEGVCNTLLTGGRC